MNDASRFCMFKYREKIIAGFKILWSLRFSYLIREFKIAQVAVCRFFHSSCLSVIV